MNGKRDITLLASAARTATVTAGPVNSPSDTGVCVYISATASADTPSVVPKIQGQCPASGAWFDILEGAAITGASQVRLSVAPDLTPVANVAASAVLPANWRVVFTAADSDSLTYSAGATTF